MFPIFAFAFFLILYLLDLTFTLFYITIPIATFIAFLTNIFLVFWLILRIGPSRTFEKLKSWKTSKRFFIQAGANFIPILDFFPWPLWFIYKEYTDKTSDLRLKTQDTTLTGSGQASLSPSPSLPQGKGETQEEIETGEASERRSAGVERLQELEEERQGKRQDSSFKPQETSDQRPESALPPAPPNRRGGNAGVSTISEVLSGRELLPTSPEAFESDYSGKKTPLVNRPEYYENIISQQNKKEKERSEKLARQGINSQKENLQSQLKNFLRMRDQAMERFGSDSKYAQRLIKKADEMNPENKKVIDDLTI